MSDHGGWEKLESELENPLGQPLSAQLRSRSEFSTNQVLRRGLVPGNSLVQTAGNFSRLLQTRAARGPNPFYVCELLSSKLGQEFSSVLPFIGKLNS